MATVHFQGKPIQTSGTLPKQGEKAPDFTLTAQDLSDITLRQYQGHRVILNIFPSLDTPVCAASVRRFNQEAISLKKTIVICISADLPFAQQRFCSSNGLEKVKNASVFRSPEFGQSYGVTIGDGPLRGLLARAVVVIDAEGTVLHQELVPEIAQEPDYEAALAPLR